jgi:hypothetical protein
LVWLIAGYAEVAQLPPESSLQISLLSLLIGVRALARGVQRPRSTPYQHHLLAAIRRALAALS